MNIDPTPLDLKLIDIDILTLGQAVHTDRSSKRASMIFSPLFPFQSIIITIIIQHSRKNECKKPQILFCIFSTKLSEHTLKKIYKERKVTRKTIYIHSLFFILSFCIIRIHIWFTFDNKFPFFLIIIVSRVSDATWEIHNI